MLNLIINKAKIFYRKNALPKFKWLNYFLKKSKRKFSDSCILLDIGCGNNSPSITTATFPEIEYWGLDKEEYNLSDKDVEILADKFIKIDLSLQTSLLKEKLPYDYYDFIIMGHIVEHLDNGLEIIDILCSKLKTGGGIYIEFPSAKSLSLPSAPGTLNFCDDNTHVRVYTIQEIANVLLKNRFKIIKAGTRRSLINLFIFPIHIVIKLLQRKPYAVALWDVFGFAEFVYAEKI